MRFSNLGIGWLRNRTAPHLLDAAGCGKAKILLVSTPVKQSAVFPQTNTEQITPKALKYSYNHYIQKWTLLTIHILLQGECRSIN